MPAVKQSQPIWRHDPFSDQLHVLKIIGRLMPLIGAAPYNEHEPQTCLEITPRDGARGPYLSIRLFLWRYRAQFAMTREELEALPFTLLPIPSTPVILDDYAMFCLERLYELETSERPSFEYTEDEREILTGMHAHFQMECIDAIVHRIHMADVQAGYSSDIRHMTLRREVVWYSRFIPWQRADVARLGERFLLAHVMDLYRTFRQQPHTAGVGHAP